MPQQAKLTQGSTLKHVSVMSFTGALGLMAMFLVDLVDMLFLSMLDQHEIVAAVGFASTIMFFTVSLSIAVSVAATALVAKAVGSGNYELARRRATHVLGIGVIFSTVVVWLLWPHIPELLSFLGANSLTLELATGYLEILMLGMPAVMVGMIASGIMRALGDARRAMYATLLCSVVNAVLDPLLIFVFGLGIHGAAIASLIARFSMLGVSYWGVVTIHGMLGQFKLLECISDFRPIAKIAVPAMLTNMSSPLANAIVMEHAAEFGDDAVAGVAIVGRIIPVVFGGLFALSGAVGPVLAQNYGADQFKRMHDAMTSAVAYALGYCLILCTALFFAQDFLVSIFNATDETASLIRFFATYGSFSFFFQSLLFIAIAAFNNLGRPLSSTLLNFGRATLGTWPLIIVFGWWMGADGVIFGQAIGSVIFGLIGFVLAKRYLYLLEARASARRQTEPPAKAA